jgi:hypothetical protein
VNTMLSGNVRLQRMIIPGWVVAALTRLFLTIISAVLALSGASNWVSAAAMLTAGLVLDGIRFAFQPDVLAEKGLVGISAELDSPEKAQRYKTPAIFGMFISGILVIAPAIYFSKLPSGIDYTVSWPNWLKGGLSVLACCTNNARRFPDVLVSKGFPDRAHVSAIFYEVVLACFLMGLILGLHRRQVIGDVIQIVQGQARVKAHGKEVSAPDQAALWMICIGIAFYICANNLIPLSWNHTRTSWDIYQSGQGFIYYSILMIPAQFCIRSSYAWLVFARLLACPRK